VTTERCGDSPTPPVVGGLGASPPEGPWKVERDERKDSRGAPIVTWWVTRAPSWYLAELDTEVEAVAVRDALNRVGAQEHRPGVIIGFDAAKYEEIKVPRKPK